MVRKPDIQYVGQFYVHGSEARVLAPEPRKKQPKTTLPLVRLEKLRQISIDPVAIVGLMVAVVMLATLVAGTLAVQNAWQEYENMKVYVGYLQEENTRLTTQYHNSYDIEQIRTRANTMGLIPRHEVQFETVSVTVPEAEAEPTAWEEFVWFLKGLFA